ncbi:MAG: hypothetical protein CVT63_01950 [Candidatus Anoxymicrobium japonicum]|uniref:Uncharacterized protein n=1 Tax=Candidatus Anoxymicrobium japonicum TaxID=2013648 RepID=A0A2N3G785_9ACTN|nr:MAG: hypothetical protein CVT63_01950 [Candidatus Anoxymicrobium japonicum]
MHVPKEKIKVTILVERFRIVGDIFRYPGARLLDLVNVKDNAFMPVTDAQIFSLADGKLVHTASFVGVNRTAIMFFYPSEEYVQQEQETETR